jgi:hypothetical protein
MPARAITAVTILLIERTDQLLAGPRSHTRPRVTRGLLWWSAWWASHSRNSAFRAIERHAAPAIALAVADHEPAGAPGLAFTTAQRKAWRLTAHWRTNLRSVSEPEERGPGVTAEPPDPRDRLDERLELHAFQP